MASYPPSQPLDDFIVYAWATPSSHGTTTYETILHFDGTLSCNCPGWTFKRGDTRGCKHTKLYASDAEAILTRLRAGEVITSPHVSPSPAPPTRRADSGLVPTRKRRAISFND